MCNVSCGHWYARSRYMWRFKTRRQVCSAYRWLIGEKVGGCGWFIPAPQARIWFTTGAASAVCGERQTVQSQSVGFLKPQKRRWDPKNSGARRFQSDVFHPIQNMQPTGVLAVDRLWWGDVPALKVGFCLNLLVFQPVLIKIQLKILHLFQVMVMISFVCLAEHQSICPCECLAVKKHKWSPCVKITQKCWVRQTRELSHSGLKLCPLRTIKMQMLATDAESGFFRLFLPTLLCFFPPSFNPPLVTICNV